MLQVRLYVGGELVVLVELGLHALAVRVVGALLDDVRRLRGDARLAITDVKCRIM